MSTPYNEFDAKETLHDETVGILIKGEIQTKNTSHQGSITIKLHTTV